jgi:hypothetical protein
MEPRRERTISAHMPCRWPPGTDEIMNSNHHGSTRTARVRVAGAVIGVVATFAVGACGSSSGGKATAVAAPTTTATPSPSIAPSVIGAPATATTAPTSTPSASPTPTKTKATTVGYAAAKLQWQKGATAISADQGSYWAKAAADLKAGKSIDPGDTSGYPAAIKDLQNLIMLPDAQQTPAQNAQYHADLKSLNGFFQTPGLYQ